MTDKKKDIEPIPEDFGSYEEAAEFWDKHDTTDYPDAFETVEVETDFRGRHYEVEVDADVMEVLRKRASERGLSVRQVLGDLVRLNSK